MRTAPLLSRSLKRRTPAGARGASGTRALEYRLSTNHALRTSAWTGAMGAGRRCTGAFLRGGLIHRPGPRLRGDHASLRHRRRSRFRRRRRWRHCSRSYRSRRCRRRCGCFGHGSDYRRSRRRRHYHNRRRCRLLGSRSRRRRNHHRWCGFGRRRRYHYRRRRLGRSDDRLLCRRGRNGWLGYHGWRWRTRDRRYRFWWSGRMRLLLLLALFQQAHNVAGLGDPGEIDLRLDLRRTSRSFSLSGRGLRRKVLANLFGFIVF